MYTFLKLCIYQTQVVPLQYSKIIRISLNLIVLYKNYYDIKKHRAKIFQEATVLSLINFVLKGTILLGSKTLIDFIFGTKKNEKVYNY